MILPFAVWRPLKFLVERAEELAEQWTVKVKFEIKDVEFKEDRMEVVRLAVNPPKIHDNGVDPYQI